MVKRALLIGCNYPGTKAHLRGCVNDVEAVKSLLLDVYGFEEENFTVLVDTDEKGVQPTAKNIKDSLKNLVETSVAGDIIYVHFSGHGLQVPCIGEEEDDFKDEAIVPSDLNLILDDDLREIIKPLKKGANLTMVTDCCHSGGLLDHQEVQISGGSNGAFGLPDMDISSFIGMLGMKPTTDQVNTEKLGQNKLKYRAYPEDEYIKLLAEKVGLKEKVEEGRKHVRQRLNELFGSESSVKFQNYVDDGIQVVGAVDDAAQHVKKEGCMSVFMAMLGMGQSANAQYSLPGVKPPKKQQLQDEVGILITGCQSNEKSADLNVSGNKKKAGGVMTSALVNAVRNHEKDNPGEPLSNESLVLIVRETLRKSGFAQNPCLECSAKNAAKGFVTGEMVKK